MQRKTSSLYLFFHSHSPPKFEKNYPLLYSISNLDWGCLKNRNRFRFYYPNFQASILNLSLILKPSKPNQINSNMTCDIQAQPNSCGQAGAQLAQNDMYANLREGHFRLEEAALRQGVWGSGVNGVKSCVLAISWY